MKTRKLIQRHRRQIDRAVDRILTLLYIVIVVAVASLALHFEKVFDIF